MPGSGRTDTISYTICGQGPDVLFVHGNGSTQETWRGTIKCLNDSHRCISFDLRGHGASERRYDAYTVDMLVDDLEGLRRHLELESFVLVGHSLGALISAEYACRYPVHVEKLCLIAAPAGRSQEEKAAGQALIAALKSRGVQDTMSDLVKRWYTDAFVSAHPGSLDVRLEQVASIDEQVFIDAYSLYLKTEIAPRLEQISMPTLVMTGEHAWGCGSSVACSIASTIPDSKLVVFSEMKNGILTEIPGRVAAAIKDFASSAAITSDGAGASR